MKKCRECQQEISDNPKVCPNCGAFRPANEKWKERGFEYKSKTTIIRNRGQWGWSVTP